MSNNPRFEVLSGKVVDNQVYRIAVPYETFKFSGGELFVKLREDVKSFFVNFRISGSIRNSDDLMELLMVTDAIKRSRKFDTAKIDLDVPYFPYARQDRVMTEGESLSVKVVAEIINAQKYNTVTICDPHSDVLPALLNNCLVIEQHALLEPFIKKYNLKDSILVAPDAGAIKKTQKAARYFGMDMVRADKLRDVQTGEITETIVYSDNVGDKNFLIVDDICDGGRTFIELAKVLKTKTTGHVYLYVTHGIFSKGLEPFEGFIDRIYCAFPFKNFDNSMLVS